ncbi:MAG: hypothetical protein CL470_06710 [Acidimicrobiaceae bacterium]|nr:hypothetical protein [Acidimicrobiaceae bacterium]|tara:strand:+ start:3227 stop:4033 length:807 start_codon:yes stop_codon:yes gene_type:complete
MAFNDDIALKKLDTGKYHLNIHDKYWIVAGPNGGYLAALLANAGDLHVNSPDRQLRSLTTHFLAPPKVGEATITVSTERSGRLVDFLRLELRQNSKTILLGTGVWGLSGDSPDTPRLTMPDVPGPLECSPINRLTEQSTRLHEQWEIRSAHSNGTAKSIEELGPEPDLLWWIRPVQLTTPNAPLVVAISDALPPPIFVTSAGFRFVPTIDLTVHLRADLKTMEWRTDSWVLARFVTRHIANGFLEEDGQMWLSDGTLIGMSRQLSIAK